MKLLGISCYYHDSAACLVDSGRIVAAAQEERFTRKKHDGTSPTTPSATAWRRAGSLEPSSSAGSPSMTSRC